MFKTIYKLIRKLFGLDREQELQDEINRLTPEIELQDQLTREIEETDESIDDIKELIARSDKVIAQMRSTMDRLDKFNRLIVYGGFNITDNPHTVEHWRPDIFSDFMWAKKFGLSVDEYRKYMIENYNAFLYEDYKICFRTYEDADKSLEFYQTFKVLQPLLEKGGE